MRARGDVAAVVHTHAPWAVALASTGERLRPLSHEGTLFVPPGPARFTQTGDLILTRELGRDLAETVGRGNAAFMVHHGIVTCGADVVTAVMTAGPLRGGGRAQDPGGAGGGGP